MPSSRLNLNQAKAFYYVAKNASFAGAATELSVTPRAVRLQIDALEAQWNSKFLTHRGKLLVLTEAGKVLYPHAESIVEHALAAEDSLADLGRLGRHVLRIGTVGTVARRLMPTYILTFRREYPEIQIRLAEGNSREMTMSVLHAVNDLAVVGRVPRPDGLHSIPLPGYEADEVLLLVDGGHWLANRASIRVDDIRDCSLILRSRGSATRTAVDGFFNRQGFEPTNILEADSFSFVKDLVGKNAGVALVTRLTVSEVGKEEGLKALSFADGGIWVKKDIIYRDEPSLNPAARKFLAFLLGTA
jgi:DNA-binding transcriptional LysR family regulator